MRSSLIERAEPPPEDIAGAVQRDHDLYEQAFEFPGSMVARIWSNQNCLVVPRGWRSRTEVKFAAMRSERRGWPVVYRTTGGACVPHGAEVINLSLIQSSQQNESIGSTAAYDQIIEIVARALVPFGLHAFASSITLSICDGDWNVCIDGKKFGGTAQRRGSRAGITATLTHATLFCGDVREGLQFANAFLQDCNYPRCNLAAHYSLQNERNISSAAFVNELVKVLRVSARPHWVLEH